MINKNNYKIFTQSKHIEKAARHLADNNMMEYALLLLIEKEISCCSERFKKKKDCLKGGRSYNLGGEFVKSAELYLKIGNKETAANMFVSGKQYQNALDIYLQRKRITTKLWSCMKSSANIERQASYT